VNVNHIINFNDIEFAARLGNLSKKTRFQIEYLKIVAHAHHKNNHGKAAPLKLFVSVIHWLVDVFLASVFIPAFGLLGLFRFKETNKQNHGLC